MHFKHPLPSEFSRLAAEFLGTYLLVFTVALNNTTKGLDTPQAKALGIFGPTSVACVLVVLVYSLGKISGGHFNPAVTFTCYLEKVIDQKEGIMYIVVQCAAGALAGFSTILLDGSDATTDGNVVGPRTTSFAIGAPIVEFLYTFLLCFVVLNVAVAPATKGNNHYGLAIGFVIIAGGYGGGYVSGGAFNPAVALGVNCMGLHWWNSLYLPIYIACHLAAAIAAPVALHIVRPETKREQTEINAFTKVVYKIEAMFDPDDTAEFIGATFFALAVQLNAKANTASLAEGGSGNPAGTLSVGATLMCLIFAMGDISGGLFNPAVTLAYLGRFHGTGCGVGKDKICDFQTSPKEGPKYLIAQVLGACAGSGLTILIWLASGTESGTFPIAPVGPQGNFTIGQAFFAEAFATFLFCFVVLSLSTTFTPLKEFKGLAIGAAYIAAGYAFGPLSGGVLNPAITLATCIVNLTPFSRPAVPLLYVGAELLGGVLAAVVFRFVTHVHEFPGEQGKPEGYVKLTVPEGYKDVPTTA